MLQLFYCNEKGCDFIYIYPDNMKGRASLFLWRLWDMVLIVIGAVLSAIALVTLKLVPPLAFTAAFTFMSIRFDDYSIFDFIVQAFKFCVSTQQFFLWRCGDQ